MTEPLGGTTAEAGRARAGSPPGKVMKRLIPSRGEPARIVAALMLTFATGVADAVGYLALDHVFTGNMTGNVVILGMALGRADDLPVVGPAVALACFMAGAAFGGRMLRSAQPGWTSRVTATFVVAAALLTASTFFVAWVRLPTGSPAQVGVAGVIALAMGCQAASARHVAVKDVTTVVVTSTITGLAADSRLGGGRSHPWVRRVIAVGAIALGAMTGAVALALGPWFPMAIATIVMVAATWLGHVWGPDHG